MMVMPSTSVQLNIVAVWFVRPVAVYAEGEQVVSPGAARAGSRGAKQGV